MSTVFSIDKFEGINQNPLVLDKINQNSFKGEGGMEVKTTIAVLKINNPNGNFKSSIYASTPDIKLRNVKRDKNKYIGSLNFDRNDPKVMRMVETEKYNTISGFVKSDSIKLIPNEDKFSSEKKGQPKKSKDSESDDEDSDDEETFEIELFKSPNGEVIDKIKSGTIFTIVSISKENKNFVKIEIKGRMGYIEKYMHWVSETIFDNKKRCGFPTAESPEDIFKLMKFPIWFPFNKDTGEFERDKNPSNNFMPIYFYQNWVDGKVTDSQFASFRSPAYKDGKEDFPPELLENLAMEGSAVFDLTRVLLRSDKIFLQLKIRSFAIKKLIKSEQKSLQEDTIAKYAEDMAQTEENKAILEKALSEFKASPVKEEQESSSKGGGGKPENDASDLDKLLNKGPVMSDVEGMSDSDSD